ncbi:hypothetical protein FSP39_016643 [Pinctada imbricata]|uniref:Ig-like domain-containing protein n=1 Tax=Pinctada imbricata TaxID=66713 RepID=A0AA88YFE9_PINIB|nr:hypothetical protein FSP39_016643 [Pinctada imbricata]
MIFMENQGIDISRQRISDRITRWDLVIKRVQKTDAGSYECQVSSVVPIKYLIQLNVIGSAYVNLYQRINLTCNASGIERAPEDIDWFHKGHKISQKNRHWRNRFQIVKFTPEAMGRSLISRLIIDHGLAKDRGVYICRSSDLQTTSIVVHVLNGKNYFPVPCLSLCSFLLFVSISIYNVVGLAACITVYRSPFETIS